MKKTGKALSLLISAAMLLSMTACGGGSDSAAASAGSTKQDNTAQQTSIQDEAPAAAADNEEVPEGERVLTIGSDSDASSFSPTEGLSTKSAGMMSNAVAENLIYLDNDGNPQCMLAESYEWTGDSELTMKLHEGVTFGNGSPFTADDVLYTFRLAKEGSIGSGLLTNLDMDATYAADDYTVVFELTQYDAAFLSYLAHSALAIMDEETCTAADWNWDWYYGTGPYLLSEWNEGTSYVLTRNENYWGEQPYYDKVIIKCYSEESTRYSDYVSGNLDAVYVTQASYVNEAKSGNVDGASLLTIAAQGVTGIQLAWSSDSVGTFSDINIRKAFAHAIDIESMVEVLGEGTLTVEDSTLNHGSWAYKSEGVYEYDPELAKEYLAKAGYSVDNPLHVTMTAENTDMYSSISTTLQAYLKEVGIDLSLDNVGDFVNVVLPVALAGTNELGLGSPGSGADPANQLEQWGATASNALLRCSESTEPKLYELMQEAQSSKDQDKRTELYGEIQDYIHDNYLWIPLYSQSTFYIYNSQHTSFANAYSSENLFVRFLTD